MKLTMAIQGWDMFGVWGEIVDRLRLRPPLATIPKLLPRHVVCICTTWLSIPKCQSNTQHPPTATPLNPTLISWHGILSRLTQSKSKSTNPNAIYLSTWHVSDFTNSSPFGIFHSKLVSHWLYFLKSNWILQNWLVTTFFATHLCKIPLSNLKKVNCD